MNEETKIMYLEKKSIPSGGYARIGRVSFSENGTLYYRNRAFKRLKHDGIGSNYFDIETGEFYWIAGCKKDGQDRSNNPRCPVFIDEDIREEYWAEIRALPDASWNNISNL